MEQHGLEGRMLFHLSRYTVFAIVRLALVRHLLSLKEKPVCLKPSKVVRVFSLSYKVFSLETTFTTYMLLIIHHISSFLSEP